MSLSTSTTTESSMKDFKFKEYEKMQIDHETQKLRRTSTSPRDSGPLQECPTCHKFFKRISSHMLTHITLKNDPERPFPCNYCPKVFKNLSNLTIHTRSHTGFKPYICEICQKGFTQSGNLVHHLRIHSGSRPYKCPICERGFTQPGNLGNHMRLHNQEKPFRCHICDRSFTQSSNLNSHIRNNHKDFAQATMLAKLELMRTELSLAKSAEADIKSHV